MWFFTLAFSGRRWFWLWSIQDGGGFDSGLIGTVVVWLWSVRNRGGFDSGLLRTAVVLNLDCSGQCIICLSLFMDNPRFLNEQPFTGFSSSSPVWIDLRKADSVNIGCKKGRIFAKQVTCDCLRARALFFTLVPILDLSTVHWSIFRSESLLQPEKVLEG